MNKFQQVLRKNRGSFIVILISGFVTSFVFNYFKFNDSNILDLLLVIVLPMVLALVIYRYFVRSKQKSAN